MRRCEGGRLQTDFGACWRTLLVSDVLSIGACVTALIIKHYVVIQGRDRFSSALRQGKAARNSAYSVEPARWVAGQARTRKSRFLRIRKGHCKCTDI